MVAVEERTPELTAAAAGAASAAAIAKPRYPGPPPLSRGAKAHLALVGAAAVAVAVPLLAQIDANTPHWGRFALLVALVAGLQMYTVDRPGKQSYKVSIVFIIPAAMLLPAPLLALMVTVQYLPDWARSRKKGTVMGFNIAKGVIDTLAAWGVYRLATDYLPVSDADKLRFAVAGLLACFAYVAVNHLLLARMISLAHGLSLRGTNLFSFDYFTTDFFLGCLGVGIATLWLRAPYVIPFIVAPLVLIHRALSVPQLKAEARADPKTGLANARHFGAVFEDELARAGRFERPLSLIMADLDLLRDINNTHGHLAGDAVLRGIADIFREQLRQYDLPARFGGEEFCILLPETTPDRAVEIADRIRRAVASAAFEVETADAPVHATISLGVASFPRDGATTDALVNAADLAVYRAKLQGRNRVVDAPEAAADEPPGRASHLVALPAEPEDLLQLPVRHPAPSVERRQPRKRHAHRLSRRVLAVVAAVSLAGMAAGIAGLALGGSTDLVGLIAVAAFVGFGEALAVDVEETGSLSVSAVGAITAVALFGPRASLPIALSIVAVSWVARRERLHHVLFNAGALTLASLAAWAGFYVMPGAPRDYWFAATGLLAGALYFGVNVGLVSLAVSAESGESWLTALRDRFGWVAGHYLVYGLVGAVIATAYRSAGILAFVVFAIPLLLMRKSQEAYVAHTEQSVRKLRSAAETIQDQNISLDRANRLLKERSTNALESLSATVDARDSYTAGHSRRVQEYALGIGAELGLSKAELELLGYAALFHDIGKIGIPDAVLMKETALTEEEWAHVRRHAEAGAEIVSRLGFLDDAVPAIRHHHENYDGSGYPDGISGDDIPLGARIVHVADALDSMLSSRVYRPARPLADALAELRRGAGSQFCPRCVAALEAHLGVGHDTATAASVLVAS